MKQILNLTVLIAVLSTQFANANEVLNNFSSPYQTQESFEIKGQVLDEDGIPIPGVTVFIKGTSKGAVTDFDGYYALLVTKNDILTIQSLGFEDQQITISDTNRTNYDIKLIKAIESLNEIVLTDGYKTINRKLFTGTATKLKLEEVKIEGVTDPGRLLEAKDAGVIVDNVSGSFGASPRIRIRGNTSINGNNNPIWVVDGVILEDNVEVSSDALSSGNVNSLIGSAIAGINPDDIATFSILKDASATAIYGARAKNGVIVITTKKGRKGKIKVNYSNTSSYRLRPTYNDFNVLNSQQEFEVYQELVEKGIFDITNFQTAEAFGVIGDYFVNRRENLVPIGANGTISDAALFRNQTANTDWFKLLFNQIALQQTHSLSISGGSENALYFFSTSYLDDEGQSVGNTAKRITSRLNTVFQLSPKVSVSTSLSASIRDQKTPGTTDRTFNLITGQFTRDFDINPYSFALSNARSITPFDENGNPQFFRRNFAPFNILHELDNNFIDIDVTDLSFQTSLDYKIKDNLTFTSLVNLRRAITQRDHIIKDTSNQAEAYRADDGVIAPINPFLFQDPNRLFVPPFSVLSEGGINIFSEDVLNYSYFRNSVNWNPKIGDLHEFTILAGQEVRVTKRNTRTFDGFGISFDNGLVVNSNENVIDLITNNNDQYFRVNDFTDHFVGFFGSVGYNYDNRYTINGTLRRDGSNLQGSSRNARYLTSYNISGAWTLSNEEFFNSSWINFLKLKGTYGLTGDRGPLASVARLSGEDLEGSDSPQAGSSLNVTSEVPLRPFDRNSVNEIQSLVNKDLTFEKLKEFSTGIEYSLFNDRIAGEIGYYSRNSFDLIGTVRTNGVGGFARKDGNFLTLKSEGYEFALTTVNIKNKNFSWTSNINVGYNTEEVQSISFQPRLVDLFRTDGNPVEGRETSALYSTRFAGLNELGIPTFLDADGNPQTDLDLQRREDIEKILKYEGPTQPRGAGGFTNTFTYKNFSLAGTVSFKFDYKIRLRGTFAPTYTDFNALPPELANRWRLPGDELTTNIPAILSAGTIINELGGRVDANNIVRIGENAYDLYNQSSLRVADGGYVRMRAISLGYQVPKDFCKKLRLARAGLKVTFENLFLIYSDDKLNGQDPEFFNTGGSALPVPRSGSLTLNVGF
ncbi:SusC/RagA family TonB-linked outer membrane protein [Aquimarina agarivorans]|uniref:SusC/RagA family TonB-linked outer membrane protein n=1 Tax=Aquimarina agarivorans TaxID=980584 RepID=UPI000248F27E|nr:SusC/RagA family TonB-linked outer membrane protein [Aquimarina agarivorans]